MNDGSAEEGVKTLTLNVQLQSFSLPSHGSCLQETMINTSAIQNCKMQSGSGGDELGRWVAG